MQRTFLKKYGQVATCPYFFKNDPLTVSMYFCRSGKNQICFTTFPRLMAGMLIRQPG